MNTAASLFALAPKLAVDKITSQDTITHCLKTTSTLFVDLHQQAKYTSDFFFF